MSFGRIYLSWNTDLFVNFGCCETPIYAGWGRLERFKVRVLALNVWVTLSMWTVRYSSRTMCCITFYAVSFTDKLRIWLEDLLFVYFWSKAHSQVWDSFRQLKTVLKWWKMIFISLQMLFSFSRYLSFCLDFLVMYQNSLIKTMRLILNFMMSHFG